MIKLYGLKVSNYYNVVKLAMLEKGVDFEEINQTASQEPDFLKISPMGRMPAIVCDQGPLSETQAILEYLEKAHPEPRLFPEDPYQAGLAHQIHEIINNYIDSSIRPLIPAAFFGAPADEAAIEKMNQSLARGCAALGRVATFDQFIAGSEFTHADLAAVNTAILASMVCQRLEQPDSVMKIPGFAEYMGRMEERPHLKTIRAAAAESLKSILASR